MIMMTDSFASFGGGLRCFLKIKSHHILIAFNESIPQVNTQRHGKMSAAVRGSKYDLFFKFVGQLMASQIVHMIKQQSRGVPTLACTVFPALSLQLFAFWEDSGDQSTQKEIIAYFVIQKHQFSFE